MRILFCAAALPTLSTACADQPLTCPPAEGIADFRDLDFMGLSHFHADRSADFAALMKSGYFSNRKRALTVAGNVTCVWSAYPATE